MRGIILATSAAVLITAAELIEAGFNGFSSIAAIIAWLAAGDAWYRFRKRRTRD